MPDLLTIIHAHTNPPLHFLIEPAALLTDIGFKDDVDLWGLRDAIEQHIGAEIPTKDMAAWRTVGDVVEAARWFEGVGG